MNAALAQRVIAHLRACGVKEFVLCAGARNAPLVSAIAAQKDLQTWHFFEERSAGFFALGRMHLLAQPVAVVTTSGTAAAELLPAVIEADLNRLPLFIISADRPRHFRHSGAPQTINQIGLYSNFVEHTLDLAEVDVPDLSTWSGLRPWHLNVCFSEPISTELTEPEVLPEYSSRSSIEPHAEARLTDNHQVSTAQQLLLKSKQPIVLLGRLTAQQRLVVREWLRQLQAPIYAESLSGLREDPILRPLLIQSGERALAHIPSDLVIRIGGVPTLRFWRDLEKNPVSVLSISDQPWPGLSRDTCLVTCGFLTAPALPKSREDWPRLHAWDQGQRQKMTQLLMRWSRSEPSVVHSLIAQIPQAAGVFLGNSLPIREWDLVSPVSSTEKVYLGNRGANGIDGLLSTFFGWCCPQRSNWCLVGDLSTLYDLSAPWVLRQMPSRNIHIVVINNGGGKIFSRMFHNPLFENRHEMNFSAWAQLWDLQYHQGLPNKEAAKMNQPTVWELCPDEHQTAQFWHDYEQLWINS